MVLEHIESNGKLLLTAEYFVLDGALALAVPTRYGQALTVCDEPTGAGALRWTSYTCTGEVWYSGVFGLADFELHTEATDTALALQRILRAIRMQVPRFLGDMARGYWASTRLGFPQFWGLGSSSTLIHALSCWAGCNPYRLLEDTFGGSGYDIACASEELPILYRRLPSVEVTRMPWKPPVVDEVFFVYLEQKQNSRQGIARYRERRAVSRPPVDLFDELTGQVLAARSTGELMEVLVRHERACGEYIELPLVQDLYFSDFDGVVKSLGAWGGDFVMCVSTLPAEEVRGYFAGKGYSTCIGYADMVFRRAVI